MKVSRGVSWCCAVTFVDVVYLCQVTSGGDMSGPMGVGIILSPVATAVEDGPSMRHATTVTDGK